LLRRDDNSGETEGDIEGVIKGQTEGETEGEIKGEAARDINQDKESKSDNIRKGRTIWKAFSKEEGI
jgi:hypothetical protein